MNQQNRNMILSLPYPKEKFITVFVHRIHNYEQLQRVVIMVKMENPHDDDYDVEFGYRNRNRVIKYHNYDENDPILIKYDPYKYTSVPINMYRI